MKLLKIIKILTIIALPLGLYPLFALVCGIADDSAYVGMCFTFAISLVCLMGFGVFALLDDLSYTNPPLASVLKVIGGIITVFGMIAFAKYTGHTQGGYIFFGFIFSIVGYILGGSSFDKDYNEVLPSILIPINTATSIVSMLMLSIADREYSVELYITNYLIFLGIFTFANNQGHIDTLIKRRKHSENSLPSKIRGYNAILVCIIFAIGVIPFIFRKKIAAVLSSFVKMLIKGGIATIMWIMEKLDHGIDNTYSSESATSTYTESSGSNAGANMTSFIFSVVFIGAVIYLIAKYHQEIDNFVRKILFRISEYIRELLKKSPKRFGENMNGCEDSYEYAPPKAYELKEVEESRKKQLRKWKKECKQLYKAKSYTALELYHVVITGARLSGVDIPKSATSFEVAQILIDLLENQSDDIYTLAKEVNTCVYRDDDNACSIKLDIVKEIEQLIIS